MPELPEVETVCRGLREAVVGKTIIGVSVNAPTNSIVVSRSFHPHDFAQALSNRTILAVNRRGKNILIGLSGGVTLWVHLKMTGHFFFDEHPAPPERHDLVIFELTSHESLRGATSSVRRSNLASNLEFKSTSDSSYSFLRFNDYRRFGRLRLFTNDELWQQKGLKELGPEPLEMSARDFVSLAHHRSRMLKAALLDQSFVAGIGNIYADESLWAARLHPKRLTTSVTPAKLIELHRHIQRLLRLAIRKAGTSVDTYSGVNGQPGSFQKYLKVYDREGTPCPRCKTRIIRRKLGSRSAHYCPRCQRVR